MDNDTKEIIIGVAKEVAKETYQDGLQPAMKEVGGFLGTVFGVFNALLAPVKKWIIKREYSVKQFEKELELKYNAIPEINRKEPEMNILGNALEALRYTIDQDELREMFENIIISSMDNRTSEKCHPSYVDVIKQLSTQDAKLLKAIKNYHGLLPLLLPIYKLRIRKTDGQGVDEIEQTHQDFPEFYIGNINDLSFNAISKSMTSISRLGLIEITSIGNIGELHFTGPEIMKRKGTPYDNLLNQAKTQNGIVEYCNSINKMRDISSIDFRKGCYKITEFGKDFMKTCIE